MQSDVDATFSMQFTDTDSIVSKTNALRIASTHGRTALVRLLINAGVDPSSQKNVALRVAATAGHIDVVRLLLRDERVDPTAMHNWALQVAITKGHAAIVKLLLSDPRVKPTNPMLQGAMTYAQMGGFHDVLDVLSSNPHTRTFKMGLSWVCEAVNSF